MCYNFLAIAYVLSYSKMFLGVVFWDHCFFLFFFFHFVAVQYMQIFDAPKSGFF